MTSYRISVFDSQGRIIKSRKVCIMDSMTDNEVFYVYNDGGTKTYHVDTLIRGLMSYEKLLNLGRGDKIFGDIKWYTMNSDTYWFIQKWQEDREWAKEMGLQVDG